VRLTGYVDDVRPWVQASRVCVVPLRQGGGTRIKILEAMALGTPVIATSKGMEGLDVVAGEHLLVADEPADFARQTLRLLRDEALARSLAERARELVVEHYDWRAIGRDFVDLVEEAVERHQRGSA
jgi:glycosyltransferase involved in cell wall biosynthesis